MSDGLTEKELAFRNALGTRKYAVWAEAVRIQWERDHLVWHYGDGVWGPNRPKPELAERLAAKGQLRWMRREEYEARLAKERSGRSGRKM